MLSVAQMPDVIIPPGSRDTTTAVDNAGGTSSKTKPMQYEVNRRESFIRWPHSSFLTSHDLAKAGFFFTQVEDLVKCPFCGIELGRWKPGDDPLEDHRKWSSGCPFVRNQDCGNISISSTSNGTNNIADTNNSPSAAVGLEQHYSYDTCGKYGINIRANSTPEDGSPELSSFNIHKYAIKTTNAAYPQYAVLETRLKTFDEWPVSLKQKPDELAAAGFFYTGKGDQTLCFSCGGGLKSWEEDDVPWEQHARWFRNCPFLRLNKSLEYINQCANDAEKTPFHNNHLNEATQQKQQQQKEEEDKCADVASCSSSTTSATATTEKRAGEECCKNDSIKSISKRSAAKSTTSSELAKDNKISNSSSREPSTATLCKVCFTKEVGVVFLPCGHMFSCVDCAPALKNCGVCRCKLEATVRAFLS